MRANLNEKTLLPKCVLLMPTVPNRTMLSRYHFQAVDLCLSYIAQPAYE